MIFRRRPSGAVPLALVALVALGLAACGGGGGGHHDAVGSTKGGAARTSAAGATTTTAHQDDATPSTTVADTGNTPVCSAASVEVTIQPQPPSSVQPADRMRSLIGVTNRGRLPCSLNGFGQLLVGSSNPAPLPASDVDVPSAPVPLVVDPDSTAFAGVEWTTGVSCGPSRPLRVSLSWGNDTSVPVVWTGGASGEPICSWSVSLGPFVANAQEDAAFPDAVSSGIPACGVSWLSADYQALTQNQADVVVKNASTSVCSIEGSLEIGMVGSGGGGDQLAVSEWSDAIPTDELQPGATVTIGVKLHRSQAQRASCDSDIRLRVSTDQGRSIPSQGGPSGRTCGLTLSLAVPQPSAGGS